MNAWRRGGLRSQAEHKVTPGKPLFLVVLMLLFLSSLLSSLPAEAGTERWKAVTGKNGEGRILYDPDSVIPLGPGIFRVWIIGFDQDQFPRRSLEEIDCPNRIIRDIEVITERPDKPTRHTFAPSEWRGIVRESPRGELSGVLCR
jgi:hypothetical protein